jgi:hypothetical protein
MTHMQESPLKAFFICYKNIICISIQYIMKKPGRHFISSAESQHLYICLTKILAKVEK